MSHEILTRASQLIRTMQSMLSDLNKGHDRKEACSRLNLVTNQAEALCSDIESSKKSNVVEVCRSNFIGNGSIPFLISGRVSGDDDDTCHLIMADTVGDAEQLFKVTLLDDEGYEDTEDEDSDIYPTIYIINSECLAPNAIGKADQEPE